MPLTLPQLERYLFKAVDDLSPEQATELLPLTEFVGTAFPPSDPVLRGKSVTLQRRESRLGDRNMEWELGDVEQPFVARVRVTPRLDAAP